MIKIAKLAVDASTTVGAAALEFAEIHGVETEALANTQARAASDASLIVRPARVRSEATDALIEACGAEGRPYFITEGLKTREVLAWLDSLEALHGELVLHVAGPTADEAPRVGIRTAALLERIMVAA